MSLRNVSVSHSGSSSLVENKNHETSNLKPEDKIDKWEIFEWNYQQLDYILMPNKENMGLSENRVYIPNEIAI